MIRRESVSMADLTRHDALEGVADRSAHAVAALHAVGPRARFILRARSSAIAAAGRGYGVALPLEACRSAIVAARAALWLGPDEWLLLAPEKEAEDIAQSLAAALAGLPHALVDVSHRQTALLVEGPQAARVLNHGCPLDLALSAFPVGMSTRTVLGKAEIVLWRNAGQTFHVEAARSFAAYVFRFLAEARRDNRG
jgi:sarcosine oxidase subunit gamma